MDTEFWVYRNGKNMKIPPIKEVCNTLVEKFNIQEEENQRLKEENQKLKEGIWEKDEVSRLKSEYERMKGDYYRGFPISEEEAKKISEWKKTHNCSTRGTRAGFYMSYHFYPTELGVAGHVECSCGEKFNFQELG